MLLKLGGHISNCLERAANAEQRALHETDAANRCDNELLAQSWRHLARSYEFVESLERFFSRNGAQQGRGSAGDAGCCERTAGAAACEGTASAT